MRIAVVLTALIVLAVLMGSAAAKPDLTSSDEAIVFERNGEPVDMILSGESVNISVRISNTGDESANFSVEFYDGNPSEGGELIGTVQSHVNRSDYTVVSITWQTDPEAKGDHAIWVLIDPDNAVDEINEANNEYHRSIFIQIPGSMELGLHVMAVGLTVVFSSLLILSGVLYIFARLAEKYDARHGAAPSTAGSPAPPIQRGAGQGSAMNEEEKAAAIAAAIEAYEEETGGR